MLYEIADPAMQLLQKLDTNQPLALTSSQPWESVLRDWQAKRPTRVNFGGVFADLLIKNLGWASRQSDYWGFVGSLYLPHRNPDVVEKIAVSGQFQVNQMLGMHGQVFQGWHHGPAD